MISDKMQKAINEQINAELHSAYLYMSMAAYLKSLNLEGAEHWMRLQVQEELMHATKFYDYLNLAGGRVLFAPIPAVATEWKSPQAAFEAAYAHEQGITKRIANLVTVAADEKDHGAGIMLQWFVTEQVEEEANVDAIIRKLKLVGEAGPGLYWIDRELMTRALTPAGGAA